MSADRFADLQCIWRSGCKNPELCKASGHCVAPKAESSTSKTISAFDRLKALEAKLVERGVVDIKFALGALRAPLSEVANDLADAIEAYLDGRCKPLGPLGDSVRTSKTLDGIRERAQSDEALSEERFAAYAYRIALDAHEDRLKLLEMVGVSHETPARLSLPVITVQMVADYGQEGFFEPCDESKGVPGIGWSQAAVDFACMLQERAAVKTPADLWRPEAMERAVDIATKQSFNRYFEFEAQHADKTSPVRATPEEIAAINESVREGRISFPSDVSALPHLDTCATKYGATACSCGAIPRTVGPDPVYCSTCGQEDRDCYCDPSTYSDPRAPVNE